MSNRIMNVFHYEKCEEQDDDQDCICDQVRGEMDQAEIDALIDERKV